MASIIPATSKDYKIIRQIAHKTWPDTYGSILAKPQLDYMLDLIYSVDALTKSVTDKGHTFLVAKEGKQSLGFISYENNFNEKSVTRIHKIYILPAMQGRGIGKLLLDNVAEIALQHDCRILSLNVNRHNNARRFYEKLGFRIMGEEDIPLEHGYLMEDYIMEKQL